MVPFDGAGPPQQQPGVAPQPIPRPPMPPGHGQAAPSPVMQPHGHHQAMNAYGHRASGSMPGQPGPYMPPSPARQGSFSGSLPGPSAPYQGHAPLHSPHQSQGGPPPMHPPHQMPPHRPNVPRTHSGMGQGMPMQPQHDMRVSQGARQQQQQQHMGAPGGSGGGAGLSGSWQSDSDTPHRREMIQQM